MFVVGPTPFFLHYIEEGLLLSTIKKISNAEKHRYNEHFVRVYILASSKHKEGWENLRQLCKQETSSRKGFAYLSRILPAPRMFRWGYVNTEKVFVLLLWNDSQHNLKGWWI